MSNVIAISTVLPRGVGLCIEGLGNNHQEGLVLYNFNQVSNCEMVDVDLLSRLEVLNYAVLMADMSYFDQGRIVFAQ